IPLPGAWEPYVRSLRRKPRYVFEAFTRRFVQESGATFQLITDAAEVGPAVTTFYRLHLARWAAKAGTVDPVHLQPGFAPFLEEVCTRGSARGWLRLAQLRVGDAVAATSLGFLVNRRWSAYLTGMDSAWQQKRPGRVLDGFIIHQAIR